MCLLTSSSVSLACAAAATATALPCLFRTRIVPIDSVTGVSDVAAGGGRRVVATLDSAAVTFLVIPACVSADLPVSLISCTGATRRSLALLVAPSRCL